MKKGFYNGSKNIFNNEQEILETLKKITEKKIQEQKETINKITSKNIDDENFSKENWQDEKEHSLLFEFDKIFLSIREF